VALKIETLIILMGRLEDYEQFYVDYTNKYGSKVAVLYQFGKFHEVYGVDNEREKVGNVIEIADLLGIKDTRVKTSILENSRENPQMAGFNSVNLDERVDKLVNYGYTVVVVNQVPGTCPVQRAVDYIQSPSTSASASTSRQDPFMVSIYFDRAYSKMGQQHYNYIGMAAMDATTGKGYFYESNSSPSDPMLAEDDLTRFLQTFNPVEVVLNYGSKADTEQMSELIDQWGFRNKHDDNRGLKPTVFTDTATSSKVNNLAFQEQFLSDFFSDHGFLNVLEYLDLVKYSAARIAYIYLLDFCSNHNIKLLNGLSRPTAWGTGQIMTLDTNSIVQLNITDSYYDKQRQNSVVSFLSKFVKTAMGRRLLKDRLLNPITDVDTLNQRYESIDYAQQHLIHVKDNNIDLSNVRDLDRLHRKMALGTLAPAELYMLDQSYITCHTHTDKLLSAAAESPIYKQIHKTFSDIGTIRSLYVDIIDIEEAGKCTVTEHMNDSIFRLGWNADIDSLSAEVRKCNRHRDIICQKFSDMIAKGSQYCKYKTDLTNTDCYCSVTKAQYKKVQLGFPNGGLLIHADGSEYSVSWEDMNVDTRNKSNVKFTLRILSKLLTDRNKHLNNLRLLSIKLYRKLLDQIQSQANTKLTELSLAVSNLDMTLALALASTKHGYCRPHVYNAPDSYLKAHRLRHPLVELKNAYIPQNINLGQKEQCGMLLYGVNQTGKSCTMKSVGVSIIMAQAGIYVPAESFTYSPYNLLTTRILGNDSIDRGLSTFAVEMIELRSILTRCNHKSLNLGDEVCHGTESSSAVALVAASIKHMSAVKANFIFATHLHELSEMEEVTNLDNVKHYHLTVDFDGDKIVYNRVMKTGSGLGLYGIEVAKHLKLPHKVLEDAYAIRNKYFKQSSTPTINGLRNSRYNSNVIVSGCRINECRLPADHTHHIRHQVEGEIIDGCHKNNKDNLVPLCEAHHNLVHGSGTGLEQRILVIFGYHQDGSLDYRYRKKIPSLL
jgi:DNA mismatch repair protein MutS